MRSLLSVRRMWNRNPQRQGRNQGEDAVVVELGGGLNPHPAAEVVIDLHHPQGSDRQDAVVVPWTRHVVAAGSREYRSLPIESGSVDVVYASHFLEHTPAGQPRLDVFNEARRVLRTGGVFEFLVPLTGWTEQSLGAKWAKSSAARWMGTHPLEARWMGTHRLVADPRTYADPTHVSAWWFPQSLLYFTGSEKPDEPAFADYGVQAFLPLDGGSRWQIEDGWVGHAWLMKP